MLRNIVLIVLSSLFALAISWVFIRLFAPGLIGAPIDLKLVSASREVPPFYEGAFRTEDYASNSMILNDPYTVTRTKPFMREEVGLGPHDLLGFRNRSIRNLTDILILGDSQTYGNNAILEENWPGHMQSTLGNRFNHYSMATPGWAAPQYLNMLYNGSLFRPRLVVTAIYTGNDAIESFRTVYGVKEWGYLRPDEKLSVDLMPEIIFPAPEDETNTVEFSDGVKIVLTPKLRFLSNDRSSPAVMAGYEIIKNVISKIAIESDKLGIKTLFMIIPTEELVYRDKIVKEGVAISPIYDQLILDERKNIDDLVDHISGLEKAGYLDILSVLQSRALSSKKLYPDIANGHPLSPGYEVIGKEVSKWVLENLDSMKITDGLVGTKTGDQTFIYLLRDGVAHLFTDTQQIYANGWLNPKVTLIDERLIAPIPKKIITDVDPELYGPME